MPLHNDYMAAAISSLAAFGHVLNPQLQRVEALPGTCDFVLPSARNPGEYFSTSSLSARRFSASSISTLARPKTTTLR